jgi:hypothetical protein
MVIESDSHSVRPFQVFQFLFTDGAKITLRKPIHLFFEPLHCFTGVCGGVTEMPELTMHLIM